MARIVCHADKIMQERANVHNDAVVRPQPPP